MSQQFQVKQFIFIKSLSKRGKVQAINDDGTFLISYFVGKNKLRKDTFPSDDIEVLKGKQQTNKTVKKENISSKSKRKPLEIKIKYHDQDLTKIEKIPQGDWIDLRAVEDMELKQFDYKLISLGISMQLPRGFEAHVLPRSSTYKTWGIILANSQGVIDESYCGTNDVWRFPAVALKDTVIKKGDRICQFRIMKKMPKVKFTEVEELNNPNRGGIGSTGRK